MGGRIDHTLSNLNTLLTHEHLRIVLLGDSSTARLVPAGSCTIHPALVRENLDVQAPPGHHTHFRQSPLPLFFKRIVLLCHML